MKSIDSILSRERALLPIGLVAAVTGISYARVRKLCQNGTFRVYVWTGSRLIGWASVEAVLEKEGGRVDEPIVALTKRER